MYCLDPQQLFQQQPQPQSEPISEICLGCICESISSCNRTLTCEGDVCGMFRITWAYWADSGKPVLEGDNPNDGLGNSFLLSTVYEHEYIRKYVYARARTYILYFYAHTQSTRAPSSRIWSFTSATGR